MKLALVTDAWHPQVNGVVRTLSTVVSGLEARGDEVKLITPQMFRTVPLPSYPEIPLSLFPRRKVRATLDAFAPDAVHIATEGPLGWAARRWCLDKGMPFTTSYHTQFPEYVALRLPVPLGLSYAVMRHFHSASVRTLAPTETMRTQLVAHGFRNVEVWGHGVDVELFRPQQSPVLDHLVRPISICSGRVAIEKNLDAFLDTPLPGTRVVIGEGPDLSRLRRKYPDVVFTGYLPDADMVRWLAAADVFVFPSRTDTFGLVMLEAMACSLPVAAFPVTGPQDVVQHGITGWLDEDLQRAVLRALILDRARVRREAEAHAWPRYVDAFRDALQHRDGGNLTKLQHA